MKKFNKSSVAVIIALVVSFMPGFTGPISALAAGPAAVNLGTAGNFVILSKTGITNVPTSNITGNIGTSLDQADTSIAFAGITCGEVTGSIYSFNSVGPLPCVLADSVLFTTTVSTAVSDMQTAYTNASNPATPTAVGANLNVDSGTLNGNDFAPGTYTWDTPGNVTITGDITLTGTAIDVWIFQITGTLGIDANKKIILAGGALPQNVFWRVAGAVTLKPGSHFEGNILAQTNIAMQAGATLTGRALAQTAVTLISNTISSAPAVIPAVPVVLSGGGVVSMIVPQINILKVPTPLALPAGPGPVAYDYTVWNVGQQISLTGISVTDDKCSPVAYVSGDVNSNNKLDPGENWKYSCTATLSNTTTNTAVATGYANDVYHQVAYATAITTVVVNASLPSPLILVPTSTIGQVLGVTTGFPNTGFPPEEKNDSWSVAILGILALASVSIVVALKKRTINN
ncbi:MAG: ice-binding family protein [Minisyncoccia bacterium]